MSDQDIKVGQKYFYKGYSQEYIFEILSLDPYELKYLCTEPGKSDTKEIVVSTFDFKSWIKRGHLALINKAKEKPAVYFREEKFTYQTNRSVPEEMMNKIIESGRSFVCRNFRTWPLDKNLRHHHISEVDAKFPNQTNHTVKFFWEDKEVEE